MGQVRYAWLRFVVVGMMVLAAASPALVGRSMKPVSQRRSCCARDGDTSVFRNVINAAAIAFTITPASRIDVPDEPSAPRAIP